MPWTITARDRYCDLTTHQEIELRVEENEAGQIRQRELVACKDGTFRSIERTGLEGALRVACQQVKVDFVSVVTPRLDRRLNGSPVTQREDALARIQAMQNGTSLMPERGDDGFDTYTQIGFAVARQRYGRETQDVCERIPSRSGVI